MECVILTLTNPCSGKVTVALWGHVNDLNPWSSDDGVLAVDEAYLKSGIGSVKVQNDVVEEGTNVHILVTTDCSHSDKSGVPVTDEGWYLRIYNPAGARVFDRTVGDDFDGTIDWLVPAGSYSPTSSNIFKVVLRNELINQDDDYLFTVGPGMLVQIPNQPSFDVLSASGPYHPGDQITIRLSATKTYNPITGFWVWVSYETSAGTTTSYVYNEKWYAASSEGIADVSFTFPDAGNVRLEASTVDTKNLNSGIAEMKWTVYADEEEPDLVSENIDWTTIAIVLILLVVAVFVYWKFPIAKPYKIIVSIGLVIAAVYFAWPLIGG